MDEDSLNPNLNPVVSFYSRGGTNNSNNAAQVHPKSSRRKRHQEFPSKDLAGLLEATFLPKMSFRFTLTLIFSLGGAGFESKQNLKRKEKVLKMLS